MSRRSTAVRMDADLVSAVRIHCFGSIRGFWERYIDPAFPGDPLSYDVFARAMRGEWVSAHNRERLTALLIDITQKDPSMRVREAGLRLGEMCRRLLQGGVTPEGLTALAQENTRFISLLGE